jgi:alpha-glucosidase (family GH31 glycosyl hydrolase)
MEREITPLSEQHSRRQILQGMGAACATFLLQRKISPAVPNLRVAGVDAEIQVVSVSAHTVRLTVLPINEGKLTNVATNGSLVRPSWGMPIIKVREEKGPETVKSGDLDIRVSTDPLTFTIETAKGERIQQFTVDKETGLVSFATGNSPLLGLGEGGQQFDRRGSTDRMRSGQGGYRLATHGARVPVPWIISTAGWAIFFHQPFGTFDFTASESKFQWSGDVYSTWETLKVHIPIAMNTSLTGIPYWGTDVGGFVPTKEFSAELYLRWFQFGAFCTLFRCHGRAWKLRLPWGWNTGDPGPVEISSYSGADIPDSSQLHNTQVEPICRKYLELRYRMLPYLYSAVRECTTTGMPVMRALWLHYSDDPVAIAREDEYLWGKDVLVAPVVEKGAASRQVYLPRGFWYDFWTGERVEGGREITREVDLETMPLYVRAGSILPLGPIKQYTGEEADQPLAILIYPGNDASFLLYEDDGKSFDYRKGEWTGIQMAWNDSRRMLSLRLAVGSRLLPPLRRNIDVKLNQTTQPIVFEGHPVEVRF